MATEASTIEEKLQDLRCALLAVRDAVCPLLGQSTVRAVDETATEALRAALNRLPWGIRVAIGEGRNDNMPGLFRDECLGTEPFLWEIALDPVDGTTPAATRGFEQPWKEGQVIAAIALAPLGTIFYPPGPERRMERIAVPIKVDGLSLDASVAENITRIASTYSCRPENLAAVVVSPHRNVEVLADLARLGVPVLTPKCGLGLEIAAMAGMLEERPYFVYGVGGGPETIVLAAGVRAVKGTMCARLWCLDEEEREAFSAVGTDITCVYTERYLIKEHSGLVAVGITDGPISSKGIILLEK